MCIFQILVAIELVGSTEGALFQFMIDYLHVDELTLHQVDVHPCTEELLCQDRNVEAVGVKASQVAAFDVGSYLLRHILEGRAVLDVFIINAMDGRCLFGNMHFGVDAESLAFLIAVRIDFEVADFYNSVRVYIRTRGFQIKKHQGIF